jgi:hypothetical protein
MDDYDRDKVDKGDARAMSALIHPLVQQQSCYHSPNFYILCS